MFSKKLFRCVLMLGVALLIMVSGTHVMAGSGRVTRGDVEAALQSWNTGLRAIRFTSRSVAAASLDGLQRGRIVPAANGAHYCVEDWHVILIAWIAGGDQSYTYQDAVADLAPTETSFILDGETLSITETPIVRRVGPTLSEEDYVNYGFAVGSILSPADAGVGAHALTWLVTLPDESFRVDITFYMDPPDSGACAQ